MEIEGAKQQIDDLVYHYHSDGNQLKVVNDDPTLTHHEYGFADNGSFQNNEYNYDENGNMIEDLNKGIDLITYNHLNLPTHIYFANNGTAGRRIGYVYTANGIKLRKYTHLNTNAEGPVTDYVGAYVYENNELQLIQTSEGRLVPNDNGEFNYEYALKDLPIAIGTGNTRVMFDQTGEVLQDQSYYPFGLSMGEALTFDIPSSLPDNKYLYNGKELQMDFDLGWYDYGARFYDPQIGRWHVIDPMYARHYDWTPYAYVLNNPIINIDLYGFTDWKAIMKGSAMVVGGLTSVIGAVTAAFVTLFNTVAHNKKQNMQEQKDEKTAYVTNNSKKLIYFKPEKDIIVDGEKYSEDDFYALGPGEKWYHPVDGVKTEFYQDQVFKVPGDYGLYGDVTVDLNGDVDLDFYGFGPILSKYYVGWKTRSELPDKNWEALFLSVPY
jgi:RHS repeat-associated protein